MKTIPAISLFILISAILVLPTPARPETEPPVVVNSVDVRGLMTMKEDELVYLLGLETGTSVTYDQITQGIKRAFVKGILNSLSVERTGGDFVVNATERDIVERVIVRTNYLNRRSVLEAFGIDKGDYVDLEMLNDGIAALEEYMVKSGYIDASVEMALRRLDPLNRIEVSLEIDEGKPGRIKEIVIIGRPKSEVVQRIRTRVGEPFDAMVLQDDLASLREYYVKRGYVRPAIGPWEFIDGRLVIGVQAGQRLDIVVKGNESFPDRTLVALMPFVDEGDINDDLLAEGVERIVEFYHERGYSDIQVAPVVRTSEGSFEIRLYISEGKVKTVRSVVISVDGREDRSGAKTMLSNREGGVYLPSKLEDDARSIDEFYNALGYRDVVVRGPFADMQGDKADIRIEVDAGAKYLVGEVTVSGNNLVPLERINEGISIRPGDPFNEVDITSSKRNVQNICRTFGHFNCTVRTGIESSGSGVSVAFLVDEGEKFFFGRTVLSGNRLVSYETIRRHILYDEGDPLDMGRLVQTRQRLMGLRLFSRVEAELMEFRGNTADVHLNVDERRPGTIDFGIGYGEYEGFRTFVEIGYGNMFDRANSGSLRLEASSLWRRYILNYTEPYFLGTDMRSRTFLLREERRHKNIDTGETLYRIIKNAASTGLEKDLGKNITASMYYEYSIVDTYDLKPDIILSREDEGTVAISSISPAIYYKTLDNTFDPTRGVLLGIKLKAASKALLSETEFSKTTLQASVYRDLMKRVVGALSLRGGMAELTGETMSLPVVERFYLGGRNSVRGFTQDSIGPVGSAGVPTGGNYFLLANLEFRITIKGSWRTVLFGDCGNVWLESNDVSSGDLRCSAGLGLRYNTPVGPLRLDQGYKIERLPGESSGELHFSIGHAF